MITVKVPYRISFFGGSTDYFNFFKKHGSFIIGTTIDKYMYLSMRLVPKILLKNNESRFSYSKIEIVDSFDKIQNPLIRETLKYKNVSDPVEFISFVDIPSRTGLGGSSSYCVGLIHLINLIYNKKDDKRSIANDAIYIERVLLKESGGIQDQIWASYGGFNTIEINKSGVFYVKPVSVTEDFKKEFEDSLVMIYTDDQREQNSIAKSYEDKDRISILEISKQAHSEFLKENISEIGKLLYKSWVEKRNISNLISNNKIDNIINKVMNIGAYGAKLLGSGGCGFVLVICDPITKHKIKEVFKDNIMNFKFSNQGVSEVIST